MNTETINEILRLFGCKRVENDSSAPGNTVKFCIADKYQFFIRQLPVSKSKSMEYQVWYNDKSVVSEQLIELRHFVFMNIRCDAHNELAQIRETLQSAERVEKKDDDIVAYGMTFKKLKKGTWEFKHDNVTLQLNRLSRMYRCISIISRKSFSSRDCATASDAVYDVIDSIDRAIERFQYEIDNRKKSIIEFESHRNDLRKIIQNQDQ